MGEKLLSDNETIHTYEKKLIFRYLPGYAKFIRTTCLLEYVKETIRISKEMDLPVLKLLTNINEDELVAMSVKSNEEFLLFIEENRLGEQIDKSLKLWMDDKLGILKREEITADDINLAGYIRKKTLLKFLTSYTQDVNEVIGIINDIDAYSNESDTSFTNVYITLLKDRIQEQSHFSESISNTTPGLNYVFDLENRSLKYINKNFEDFTGCTLGQLKEQDIVDLLLTPGDREKHFEYTNKLSDKDVVSRELQMKDYRGNYRWMRNYISVFKRDKNGSPTEAIGIILNIDAEKEIADQLMLRERQLLNAQKQANIGSFELDIATGKLDVTPQFEEIFEINGEIDIDVFTSKIHSEDMVRVDDERKNAIEHGTIYDTEYRCLVNGKEKIIWAKGIASERNGRKIMACTVMDVTERNNMLQQLKLSEQRYKQAQELSHIGNWTLDLQTGKIACTDTLYDMYEIPRGTELTLENLVAYTNPGNYDDAQSRFKNLLEHQTSTENYYEITSAGGVRKILHSKTEVSKDPLGNATKMMGVIQDVTERQQLIDRLQRSDDLYKQAQAISHIGNWIWDVETRKLEWSDELYRIYDLGPQQDIDTSATIELYNHPEDKKLISETIREAIEKQQPFDFEYRIVLSNEKIKILHAKGEIAPGRGKAFKIYGTLQDITEQKLAEKRISDYQVFIKKITDVTPSVIATYNIHTGKYSFINQAIEKLLGYTPARVMEQGAAFFISIIHPDDINSLLEKNTKALEQANSAPGTTNEPITEFKYRMRNSSGVYRWFHTYGTIFERNDNGLVESVLNISIDITEQEIAEQSLFQKNLQLQQSNTSLEEYAYVASHDLKEPLRKISTFSDRLLNSHNSKVLDEPGKVYLHKIIDSSRRMQKMISDLLSVSTILGNKSFEPSDLNIILSESIQSLEHKIEETKAMIEADELPVATIVPSQFRQLFQNLINNSLKFSREGTPCHIKITHRFISNKDIPAIYALPASKKYLRIDFADNGIGFDDQYAIKIFAIFQRLHGKTEYEGTGIGLAVCKKIIENHRGIIFAKGHPNEGAIFTIIIPV